MRGGCFGSLVVSPDSLGVSWSFIADSRYGKRNGQQKDAERCGRRECQIVRAATCRIGTGLTYRTVKQLAPSAQLAHNGSAGTALREPATENRPPGDGRLRERLKIGPRLRASRGGVRLHLTTSRRQHQHQHIALSLVARTPGIRCYRTPVALAASAQTIGARRLIGSAARTCLFRAARLAP